MIAHFTSLGHLTTPQKKKKNKKKKSIISHLVMHTKTLPWQLILYPSAIVQG
jgi:hypothetical protein